MIEEINNRNTLNNLDFLRCTHVVYTYCRFYFLVGAELYMRGRRSHARMAGMAGSASPRVVAHAELALDGLGALVGALAAVLLVLEEVDALAVAAGVPVLALPVAVAAVLHA